MILALDVGNTNIVIGCIDNEKIYFSGRFKTDRNKTELEYAIMFKDVLDIYNIDVNDIDGAIISSVVPPLVSILSEAIETVTGHKPIVVNHNKLDTGLKVDMDNSKQVGSDLVVDALAALAEYKPPLIIFDMGTATTISVIDRSSTYIGTVILPGIKISQDALTAETSQLPSISFDAPANVIGKNTIDCMKSGMVFGNASMMDGMIQRIKHQIGNDATVIATGGLAECIVEHCVEKVIFDDDLLLKGLLIIYNRNK